jgi:hypothetical protein
MSSTDLVRASRDGDQFHYLWAARRALRLLTSQSGLVAMAIEGASPSELKDGQPLTEGEQLIDVAEYYSSEVVEAATLIRYMQLKHSTVRAEEHWTASSLEKTLTGFSKRYVAISKKLTTDLAGKIEFWFVSNRPVSTDVLEAIEDAANQAAPRHPGELEKLKRFTSLDGAQLSQFCQALRFDAKQDGYWDQRNLLFQDVTGYLPDSDVDAPTQLKELITRKALSESAENPAITKVDVLRAFKTDERGLFPAPCLIERFADAVPREQEPELTRRIIESARVPVIVHADGGVGKSIFATRIPLGLPGGSVGVLYDCFGNAQYRSASGYRHRHRDALVQIANELSAQGLCHPLIPTTHADASAYVRAFLHRLGQAAAALRAKKPDALVCVVVDAADNAQIAAQEIGEPRSFAPDLLREALPDGVRLVVLCRTHRQALLDPPPHAVSLELQPFSRTETAVHLRKAFPDASEHDVNEFHRLTSRNPRVQALALASKAGLQEILRLLGPNPTTVESAIGAILDQSIAKLRDAGGSVEKAQIDMMCAGLAALRPLIPIPVLAAVSSVPEAAIRSFAFDIGRPLLVTGDTVQFFDEPAETWFRDRFRPTASGLADFIARLRQLTAGSGYVASALPQLMLEASQFSELVTLALSSEGLPETSPLERRDVEIQRLQFALKASLRARRYPDAAKLALKAGGESAGDDRQRALIQDNTDLASVFLGSDRVQELVSRRTFGSGWVGSHHAYEAGLMSGHQELVADARSRLRMADEWLVNWSRLPSSERRHEDVSDKDRAEIAIAEFNVHGARRSARSLRRWRARERSFWAGRILAQRFIDHGRFHDLDELAIAARNDLGLILAITLELRTAHRLPPKAMIRRAIQLVRDRRITIGTRVGWDSEETPLRAVTAIVECGYKMGICDALCAVSILERYLPATPPRGLSSRYCQSRPTHMRAYALRAALAGMPPELIDLAHPELRRELEKEKKHSDSRDAQEFKEDIGALLPWHQLWAKTFLGQIAKSEIAQKVAVTLSESSKAARINYRDEFRTSNEIAHLWFDILVEADAADASTVAELDRWANSLKQSLFTPTLLRLARLAAGVPALQGHALAYGGKAFMLTRDERADAEQKANGYIEVARAILSVSASDAAAYFNQAVEVSSKIGEENLSLEGQTAATWQAIKAVLDASGLTLPSLNELVAVKNEKPWPGRSSDDELSGPNEPQRDWDALFSGCDLTSANGISLAHQRFRNLEPPYYTNELFRQACNRVAPGKEPELIRVLADVADFDLYHLRNFLEQIPESWKSRIAVKSALADTLKVFSRRFCMKVAKSRDYEVLPFDLACELSGADESQIVDVVLAAIGESPELAGPKRLFSLVALLAVKLSQDEALSVLSYGLDLFDSVLEDRDGDGDWTDALLPPKRIEESLAGYIWAGLASPRSAIRWEAAHAIFGLCALGRTEVIADLIGLADANKGQPFVDTRLHFYSHHARQWLLVGLSRAVLEYGAALVPHKEFFLRLALSGLPHVLIRALAARIALKLDAEGLATVPTETRAALEHVNASPLAPVAESARSQAVRPDDAADDEEDRYYFGIDFGPYWLAPLGRCFAKPQAEVEQEALRVIREEWGCRGRNRWDEDERARQGQFRHETTHHSHGSYPRIDDLNFYLSYHAMMVAAGRLLTTAPLRRGNADDYEDGFAEWLSRHDISRNDGRWLADRRDPVPLGRPEWINEEGNKDWRWSVRRDDFERVLFAKNGWINVWGSWTELDSNREESLAVHSALVLPERSQSLLRALQTTLNPHDYRIPDADDDLQINEGGFQLKGWIIDRTHDRGMDHLDPWSGGINYGPPSPAPEVVDRFGLTTDADRRAWRIGSETKLVMASQVWGFFQEKDDERERPSGRRLQASFEFVVEFLRSIGMDLIVEVEIQRRIRRRSYEAGDDDGLQYIPPYCRIFLIRTDGEIYSL